jgi:hypothetical protein
MHIYNKKVDEDFVWLFALYFIGHGLILSLGNAVFWDDWAYIGAPTDEVLSAFSQSGDFLNFRGWIYILFLNVMPTWVYKVATFGLIFFSGVYLKKIAIRDLHIDEKIAFWIAVLFLTTPLYIARVVCTDFNYTLSVYLFMLGWWWIKSFRYISLFVFAISFNTQSLLMFYALPVMFLYMDQRRKIGFLRFIYENIGIILLPFLWFFIKINYFPSYGRYANYNKNYNIENIMPSMKNQWVDFLSYLYNYIFTLTDVGIRSVIFIFIACLLYGKFRVRYFFISTGGAAYLFMIGVGSLALGLFPYWILGHVPTFWEWTSRHQVLMPFGVAFILVALAGLFKPWMQGFLLSLSISLGVSINISNLIDLHNDWNKQKAIIKYISNSDIAKNSSLIIFRDNAQNALYREYRFYEWNGLINKALPGEFTRFGIGEASINDYKNGLFDGQITRFYSTRKHIKLSEGYPAIVSISGGDGNISVHVDYLIDFWLN